MELDRFTVGKRYGKAIFELAQEENKLDEVYIELMALRKVYLEVVGLGDYLTDVRLNLNEKQLIFEELKEAFTEPIVKQSLIVIYRYKRMADMLLIIDEFERRYDEVKGLLLGTITSAVSLTPIQIDKISSQVAARFGYKSADLKTIVDPNIIGGVIVEANHQVIDGSLRKRLAEIKQQLIKK